ncbi:MAG: hypothetical protein WC711_04175 [Candidatus Staskawiczbacteria bacterium]|jgi:hypothetical protein
MAEILQGGVRDTINTSQFAVTNYEEDYSFDADTATLSVTSNVLSTLIRDLIRKGIINGTVA